MATTITKDRHGWYFARVDGELVPLSWPESTPTGPELVLYENGRNVAEWRIDAKLVEIMLRRLATWTPADWRKFWHAATAGRH